MQPLPVLGTPLPKDLLALRSELSTKPEPVETTSGQVRLRPYQPSDAQELFEISNGSPVARLGYQVDNYDPDELVWRFMPAGPFADAAALHDYQHLVDGKADAATSVVAEAESGDLLGSITLMANDPANLKIEIGSVWFTPAVQGSGIPATVTRLVADHVFEHGYQRFEWKCHSDNVRSRAFALHFGFQFEGVQDAHLVVKGRRRDTAWFRILAAEWPDLSGRFAEQ